MKLLLDTCTFLWVLLDDDSLSRRARDVITEGEHEVYLSAVSVWEIAVKQQLGRLRLPEPLALFLPEQRQRHGIDALPLDEDAVLHSSRLPSLHSDPFDRMLVCQAIALGLSIVTPDPLILQYPIRVIW